MTYTIVGLEPSQFAPLFALSDDELQRRGIAVRHVDASPGFACRISLEDAPVGERVLLLNYMHLDTDSPFRASHGIYVREGVEQARYVNDIPAVMRRRVISLRAFDGSGMLLDGDRRGRSPRRPPLCEAWLLCGACDGMTEGAGRTRYRPFIGTRLMGVLI